MRVRLGERLAFEIDVPEDSNSARMPPMMLLPLVDHALVNGPQPGDVGGAISVATRVEGGRLRLTITDSGFAFLPGTHARYIYSGVYIVIALGLLIAKKPLRHSLMNTFREGFRRPST